MQLISSLRMSFRKFILLLMAIMLSVSFKTFTVYAEADSSADQGGSGSGDGTEGSTISSDRSGWLLYVVDKTGALKSPDVVLAWTKGTPDLRITENMVMNRLHAQKPSRVGTYFKYGAPLVNGNGQGANIRNKLVTPDAEGVEEWSKLIETYWSAALVNDIRDNDYALIMEPVFFYNIFVNGKKTDRVIAGTANTIAGFQNTVPALSPNGDSKISRYTNLNFPYSAMFQQDKTIVGITVPSKRSGKLSNGQIMAEGYGLIAIWPVKSNLIHTYNGTDSPGKSQESPKGQTNIIKSYRTRNSRTNELTDDGTFTVMQVTNKISIDDEPDYQVVGWKTSTTTNPSIVERRITGDAKSELLFHAFSN